MNKISKLFALARAKHIETTEYYAPCKKREKNLFDGLITEYRYDEVVRVL